MHCAKEDLVTMLLSGNSSVFDRWRDEHPNDLVDLSKANLTSARLNGANLSGADLTAANLSGSDLIGSDLSHTKLREADFSNANLSSANLFEADLEDADLTAAVACGANFTKAKLLGAKLTRVNLAGGYLEQAELYNADFTAANLSRVSIDEDTAEELLACIRVSLRLTGVPSWVLKSWLQQEYGFVPEDAWIADCKKACGLTFKGRPYPAYVVEPCPPVKRAAIERALRHYGLLPVNPVDQHH
jgi:Pentapeptide repeats (8 copies)